MRPIITGKYNPCPYRTHINLDKLQPQLVALVYDKIRATLNHFLPLPEADWLLIRDCLQEKHLAKGEYFIKEGQTCNHIGFLNKGITRVYYLVDGKEFTSYFNFEDRNPLVSAFTSFITRQPSQESVHVIQDAELLVFNYEQLQGLYKASPNIQKLGRLMAENNYVLSIERIYSLQHRPAQERYLELLKIYPNLINHVPHHYVASYLGITPEALSRVRKAIVTKD